MELRTGLKETGPWAQGMVEESSGTPGGQRTGQRIMGSQSSGSETAFGKWKKEQM